MYSTENIDSRIETVRNNASRLDSILSERDTPDFEIDELRQLGIYLVKVGLN